VFHNRARQSAITIASNSVPCTELIHPLTNDGCQRVYHYWRHIWRKLVRFVLPLVAFVRAFFHSSRIHTECLLAFIGSG
jgi:hypothetical protein